MAIQTQKIRELNTVSEVPSGSKLLLTPDNGSYARATVPSIVGSAMETGDFNINSTTNKVELKERTFTGTTDAWEALTAAQKAQYTYVSFTDDGGYGNSYDIPYNDTNVGAKLDDLTSDVSDVASVANSAASTANSASSTANSASSVASSAASTASTASSVASRADDMIWKNTDQYSTSKAYSVGDYVIHNNTLYKCTTACSAGSWSTNSSKFTSTTLSTAVTELNSALASQATKVDDAFKHSSYVNFPSGLKMCWGILGSWDNSTQKNYRYNDLPITFTATPIVFCTPYGQAAQAQNYYYTYEYLHTESTYNKIKVLPYWTSKANPSNFGKSDDNFFYLAIGY